MSVADGAATGGGSNRKEWVFAAGSGAACADVGEQVVTDLARGRSLFGLFDVVLVEVFDEVLHCDAERGYDRLN